MRLLFVLVLSFVFAHQTRAQKSKTSVRDSVEVMKAVDGFLDAFSNLKWEEFTSYFANDATVFFPPSAKTPARANNKKEVELIFKNVFDNARKGKTTPPFITIQPKDTRVQVYGTVALVTFHLLDPGWFGRRTVVLRKENSGEWKIVHIHASAIAE